MLSVPGPVPIPVVVPPGSPDVVDPDAVGPPLPVAPEPITDGGGDRLVVTAPGATAALPSATLLAAQQLSDEADPLVRRPARTSAVAAARRHRATRAIVEQRRADRSEAAGA